MSRVIFVIAMGVALVAGVAFGQPEPSANLPRSAAAASEAPISSRPSDDSMNYRLGPDDKVRVITYDEPQLTGEFVVNSTGTISLPLIGDVAAAGHTVGELSDSIRDLLKKGFIKNPSVSVEVLTFRPFYILGEVNKPGEYPYTDKLTVMEAVATAGGFTYRANEKTVFIKQQDRQEEERVRITTSTEVHPGDTIRVVERYF
jgi:protein involved in polysaccharide export with SLBB domain